MYLNNFHKIYLQYLFLILNKINLDLKKYVGIHCLHGLNRTGYIINKYLCDRLRIVNNTLDAQSIFEKARGELMDNDAYNNKIENIVINKDKDTDNLDSIN
jgi:atypical dual specificity phosphatase